MERKRWKNPDIKLIDGWPIKTFLGDKEIVYTVDKKK